ncbi:hypothetical protein EYF80_009550 [Liparis tanakae]|uniref:Uncharacterized protein n=1 Tax=Liparis tanakae TaxID=230148 RepID=A0A4Z2IQN4_9TELE|nr:hypothetical protein EYF80_009550 [Liparis tanakae]
MGCRQGGVEERIEGRRGRMSRLRRETEGSGERGERGLQEAAAPGRLRLCSPLHSSLARRGESIISKDEYHPGAITIISRPIYFLLRLQPDTGASKHRLIKYLFPI